MGVVRVKGVASRALSRGLDGEGSSYSGAFGIRYLLSRLLSTLPEHMGCALSDP